MEAQNEEEEQPKGFESMPTEILEKIFKKSTLNDRLRVRAASKILCEYLTPKITELQKPDECVITSIKLSKLKNTVHFNVAVDDIATAQHFVSVVDNSPRWWKRKTTKGAECFFTFPSDGPRNFALFENAKVAQLTMDKLIPFHITPDAMKWLKVLLRGCSISKISLVFDDKTVAQQKDVPVLASIVKAKHVEFIVQRLNGKSHFEVPSKMQTLATKLAAAGVEEVTITVDYIFGKREGGGTMAYVNFDLIEAFLNAGIRRITFDADFNEQDDRNFNRFIRNLSKSDKPAHVLIRAHHLMHRIEQLIQHPSLNYGIRITNGSSNTPNRQEAIITRQPSSRRATKRAVPRD